MALKPRPLHASTNTIHAKQQHLQNHKRVPLGLKAGNKVNNSNIKDEPIKKKNQPANAKPTTSNVKTTLTNTTTKVDENSVQHGVAESYDPLLDIYPFDEELYQKVLKLELADDGLPKCSADDSFDF